VQTIHDFIKKHKVRMSCRHAASNPHMNDSSMSHYRCTLTCGKKRMTTTFSHGSAHGGKTPDVANVLSTLALDASGFENNSSIEEWAREYGYDSDDGGYDRGGPSNLREGKKIFNAVKKQTAALKNLVGDAYEELLYNTESL